MQAKIVDMEIRFVRSTMSERRQARIVIKIGILDSPFSNNNRRSKLVTTHDFEDDSFVSMIDVLYVRVY